MSATLWQITSWLFFVLYVIGFGIVSRWPDCKAKSLLLVFFGVDILVNLCYKIPNIAQLMGGMDMLYTILPLFQLGTMICLLCALADLGKHFMAAPPESEKDPLQF